MPDDSVLGLHRSAIVLRWSNGVTCARLPRLAPNRLWLSCSLFVVSLEYPLCKTRRSHHQGDGQAVCQPVE